jgi:16S rRNA (guanine966-N2)-methyltransferase
LHVLKQDAWSTEGTVIVLERATRGTAPVWPEPLESIKERRYGESALWYGRRR